MTHHSEAQFNCTRRMPITSITWRLSSQCIMLRDTLRVAVAHRLASAGNLRSYRPRRSQGARTIALACSCCGTTGNTAPFSRTITNSAADLLIVA